LLILATPFCSAREIFFAHASRRTYNRAPRQRAQRDDARRTSMESERSIAPENQSSNARARADHRTLQPTIGNPQRVDRLLIIRGIRAIRGQSSLLLLFLIATSLSPRVSSERNVRHTIV
jgi:hypothetical protein